MSINSTPIWYFINDISIIILNLIGIFTAIIFIYIIARVNYPNYSISNVLACKTCLAIGLMSCSILINNLYALRSDFRGQGYEDSFCTLRGSLACILFIKMYTSLCLKAFNRLRCIVYRIRSKTNSYRSLCFLIFIQWCVVATLVLPILLTNGITYDFGSYLCLATIQRPWQFIFLSMFLFSKLKCILTCFFFSLSLSFLVIIYYMSICFTSSVYIYILYYVMHLSLLERYRRKRQLALLRRILVLLVMLILPGVAYLTLIVYWLVFQSIPNSSYKIVSLIESFGHTGALVTIFFSNSYVRKQFSRKRKLFKPQQQKQQHRQYHRKDDYHILILKHAQKQLTTVPSTLFIEPIVINSDK